MKCPVEIHDTLEDGEKNFAEFFAGIGLVHAGLSRSGWKCVYANDIEGKKRDMYEGHFGPSPYYHVEDIWKTEETLAHLGTPPFLATASFPCIDLSLAGHWKGFDGDHSSTYFGFIEVMSRLGARRPKMIMLENVHGFLTSKDGADFARAVTSLADLGYLIDAIALDAKWFVPQSRPRIFVFGFHESLQSPNILRQEAGMGMSDPWYNAIQASAALRPPPLLAKMDSLRLSTGWATVATSIPEQSAYSLTDFIDLDDKQAWWSADETLKHYFTMETPSKERVDRFIRERATVAGTAFRRTRREKTRTEVRFDVAGCLRTPKGGSAKQIVIAVLDGKLHMRWMSPREYARLQGAADFRINVPESQALFGFGDAVCVPAIRWIDANILTPVFEQSNAIAVAP